MGLSAPVSALGKRWTLLKAMKRKLGLQDFPVSHTSVFIHPVMFSGVWLSYFLGHTDTKHMSSDPIIFL